jgi:uncharacterized protein
MLERPVVSPANFANTAQCWDGNAMVGDFERLAQAFVDSAAILAFRICGQQDGRGRPQLRCRVSGSLLMECQRCLQPVEVTVDSDRVLYLAGSEAEADRREATLADAGIEVMVVDRALDLAGVIEDEVLLSVPLVPRHPHCELPPA